ncbi:MAG: PIG-L family deacetylase [Acidobacteria bacterium]|nr:PIG-L family deacetylase [Acidobacteriota bacterium]
MNKEKWKQVPGDSLPASRFCRLIHSPVKRYLDIMMKILGITAHPDDEVGAFGGSLLLYHSRGVETHVICLTAGEAASNRGEARSREELAAIRRAEFAASCKILQVTEGHVLDYPDGSLCRSDFNAAVSDLTRRIRVIKPDLILTMGPEGAITGHLDHAMASIFATMAFHWAARNDRFPEQLSDGLTPHRTQKLYYCTAPFILPDRQPVSPPPCTATIDIEPFLETKIRASQAHATQRPLMELFAKTLRKFGSRELFHLAATIKPSTMEHETDLLAGVSE